LGIIKHEKSVDRLGGVFAGIIILLLIAAIIFIPRTLVLDKQATQYIAENTPAVVNGWNPKNLINRASPKFLSSVKSREEVSILILTPFYRPKAQPPGEALICCAPLPSKFCPEFAN
jgi:hypothetical protein